MCVHSTYLPNFKISLVVPGEIQSAWGQFPGPKKGKMGCSVSTPQFWALGARAPKLKNKMAAQDVVVETNDVDIL